MKRNKPTRVIHLKNVRDKKRLKTVNCICFLLLISFFISLSVKSNLLFFTEMITAISVISMSLLCNFLDVK